VNIVYNDPLQAQQQSSRGVLITQSKALLSALFSFVKPASKLGKLLLLVGQLEMRAAGVHGQRHAAVAHLVAGPAGVVHTLNVPRLNMVDHAVLIGGDKRAVGTAKRAGAKGDDFLLYLLSLFHLDIVAAETRWEERHGMKYISGFLMWNSNYVHGQKN
jgi:hypothetical protein